MLPPNKLIGINQAKLIEKFSLYNRNLKKVNPKEGVSKKELSDIGDGLCYGFSILFAYKFATGYGETYLRDLQKISQWDGQQNTPVIKEIFEKIISSILFYQDPSIMKDKHGNSFEQHDVFEKKLFESKEWGEERKEYKNYPLLLHLSTESTDFEQIPFNEHDMCLVHFRRHACAISKKETGYYFYDPNDIAEPTLLPTKEKLAQLLVEKSKDYNEKENNPLLCLEIITHDQKNDKFLSFYQLMEKSITKEELIAQYAPDFLKQILNWLFNEDLKKEIIGSLQNGISSFFFKGFCFFEAVLVHKFFLYPLYTLYSVIVGLGLFSSTIAVLINLPAAMLITALLGLSTPLFPLALGFGGLCICVGIVGLINTYFIPSPESILKGNSPEPEPPHLKLNP